MTRKDKTSAEPGPTTNEPAGAGQVLRQQAEAALHKKVNQLAKSINAESPEELQTILHELYVHQIELEMQNEELQRLQVDLDAERANYLNLYDLAPVGYCTISETGLIIRANLTAASLLGVSRSALIKQPISRLIYKEDQDIYYLLRNQISDSGESRTCELRMVKTDGTQFWTHLTCTAAQDESGAPILYIALSDITGRKQAEAQQARNAEELTDFKAALDEHAIVATTDARGIITYVNDKFCTISKYAREELAGQNHRILNSGHHPKAYFRELWQTISSGRVWKGEIMNRAKDDSFYWVETTITPFLDEHGKPVQYIAIHTDITERLRAAVALYEKEHLLSESQRIAHIGSWIYELTGELSWSDEMYRIYGVSPDSFVPNIASFLNLIHPHDRPAMQAWVTACEAGEKPGGLEFRTILPDGTVRYISGFGELVYGTENRLTHLAGTAQNITTRKLMEHELVAAKDLAVLANRTKDSFLATMSHEIRTPLGGLIGMLELLGFTPLDNDQRETLQVAMNSGQSLLRIVNDILDWSKIEAGKLEIAPVATSITQLVAEVVSTYARVASVNSLILEQHVDVRLSPAHIVDPLRLSQVLNNFVSNALKFTPKGQVEVRAELIGRQDDAEQVRFSVKDTGVGIAKDVQKRLFQSYSQESAGTARMYGGTGLGLAISRSLASVMGGQIDLESMPGLGSTFSITLTLPVSKTAAGQAPKSSAIMDIEVTQFRAPRVVTADAPVVLVVDDHSTNRKLMAIQLGLLGLRAETAEDGKVAFEMWRDGRFSLIITDCHMPNMDGYELTRAIRKIETDEARPRIPILAWTANALAGEMEKCHAAGMDKLLIKPVGLIKLEQALLKWLPVSASVKPAHIEHEESGYTQDVPIDFMVLDELFDNTADKAKILQDFMAQTRSDLADLKSALQMRDIPASERIADHMMNSCLAVGASELATACLALENSVRDGNSESADAVTAALERLVAYLADCSGKTVTH